MKPKLSLSIGDFPINISIYELFEFASHQEVDGVELGIGFKTITSSGTQRLSSKYSVPILSIHQPRWAAFSLLRDKEPFKIASIFNAYFNAHPIIFRKTTSDFSKKYFEWLSKMGKKYKVKILIENMASDIPISFLKSFIKIHPTNTQLHKLHTVCNKYGFKMTIDTSHLGESLPHKAKYFEDVYPLIRNIHLSDFDEKRQHLSLRKGKLKYKQFFQFLLRHSYSGLITLEMPKIFESKEKYFENIKSSITIVRRYIIKNYEYEKQSQY